MASVPERFTCLLAQTRVASGRATADRLETSGVRAAVVDKKALRSLRAFVWGLSRFCGCSQSLGV